MISKSKFTTPLDDHPSGASAAALLRIAPGFAELVSRADKALAFAGGAHHRFNDAWQTDLGNRRAEAFFAVGKTIAEVEAAALPPPGGECLRGSW